MKPGVVPTQTKRTIFAGKTERKSWVCERQKGSARRRLWVENRRKFYLPEDFGKI